jgi:large subunit ribosomal protein L30
MVKNYMQMKRVKITQVKSGIGRPFKQKRTLEALGIKRMHHTVELELTPQVQGMVDKVKHLLKIEEI